MSKEEIVYHAGKMMLKLSEVEVNDVITELEALSLEFDKINNIPSLKDTPLMTHTIDIPDLILREDIPLDSPDIDELLKNTTHRNDREVEVPKVVG